ncbi:MAG: tol-pal system YbgF family protein, partial [Gemmatimonadota bacterium]
IEEFPQSRWVAAAYLMLVRAYEGQGKQEDARRVRDALLEQFPESPEAGEVRQVFTPPDVSLQVGNAR